MIINKWNSLGSNYFNDQLEYTKNKSEKLEFRSLIQKTIDEIKKIEQDITLDITVPALQRIHDCFRKVDYKKNSSLSHSYEELIALLASKVAQSYRGNFKDIASRFVELKDDNSEGITFLKEFLEKCQECAINNMADYKSPKGIFYEIVNKKGCKAYLIGTLHFLQFSYVQENAPLLLEKIKTSSAMITELGDSYKNSKKFMDAIEFVQDTMDIGLSEWAIQNNIKLMGFETYEFHEELVASVMNGDSKDYLENFSPYLINRYHHSAIQQIYESVEAWQHGNMDEIKLIVTKLIGPDAKKRALKERNAKWLADPAIGLIERLEKMEQPISILVGCGHLCGKTGLVKSLQNTGKFQLFKRDLNANAPEG